MIGKRFRGGVPFKLPAHDSDGSLPVIRPGGECAVAAKDRGGHLDRAGVGRCFGGVRVPGIQAGIGHGKRRGAPPASRVASAGRLLACGRFGEHEPGDAVPAGETGGLPACGDNVRGGGDVDLDGAAEPGSVPFAGPLVGREANGDGVVLPVPGGAAPAGDGGADGRAPVRAMPGECGERMPERVLADAGERGQASGVAGLQQSRFRDVVAGGGPDSEPRRQDIGNRAEREVVRGCRPGQVRGLSSKRCN